MVQEDFDETTTYKQAPKTSVTLHAQPHVLELVRGPGAPRQFVLDRRELVLGRAADVDLLVESTQLSRRHMALVMADGEFTCRDLGSRNGVFLNGVKVHSAVLRHGDQLQLGDVVLVYLEGR